MVVNVAVDVALPPAVVTVILPDDAPAGIMNFSDVELAPDATVTWVEPTVTVAPSRLVPFTVTKVTPLRPVAGVKEVTVGAGGTTVNESV